MLKYRRQRDGAIVEAQVVETGGRFHVRLSNDRMWVTNQVGLPVAPASPWHLGLEAFVQRYEPIGD